MAFNDNIEIDNAMLCKSMVMECHNDTYEGILKADEEMALFMDNGVSVILDVSHIVKADVVKAIKRYCNTANETGGNLTIIVNVDHPRLQNILRLYEAHNRMTIKVNDTFMKALADETKYGTWEQELDPNALWNQIAHCDIMFKGKEVEPYCGFVISQINLRDYVVFTSR